MQCCRLSISTNGVCAIIQPSWGQWAAKIRVAKKKNELWRMCIKYRDLNKLTVINGPDSLPRIDALQGKLGRGMVFCALDLTSGYHQVPMTKRVHECSAFLTLHAHESKSFGVPLHNVRFDWSASFSVSEGS